MADVSTYVKLDRNILNWRWWTDHNTLIVFLYLLLSANIKDNGFSGITIHRGQLATSLPSLSAATVLSIRNVRTALAHLKSTGEVTVKLYPKFQVITIVNYDKYQQVTGKMTGNRQSSDRQVTGNRQQSKNVRNKTWKNINKGRSAPDSPSAKKPMPDIEHGTVDDIPEAYRGTFTNYADYWRSKNQ